MKNNFLQRNWPWFVATAGLTIAGKLWQLRGAIDLRDKIVLITGGSRGLGLAIAEAFVQEGCKLAICARDEDEVKRARMQLSELGGEVAAYPCDVTDPEQVKILVEQVIHRFGRIDVLVNNAGVISAGPIQTTTRADFEKSMDIMFWGLYNTTMAVLPHMQTQHSGRIVNITSIGGKVSVPHLLPYSTAKFAAVGFSEGLHTELARDGIIVTTVAPGLMRTGSHINTTIKGDKHALEYSLFTLLDTLPVSSISVRRAARQIVRATRIGQAELIITWQAQLAARLHGAFHGTVSHLLTLADKLLPTSDSAGKGSYTGRESETSVTSSFLTSLGRKAAQYYNEEQSSPS